jgi:hypothetical protein
MAPYRRRCGRSVPYAPPLHYATFGGHPTVTGVTAPAFYCTSGPAWKGISHGSVKNAIRLRAWPREGRDTPTTRRRSGPSSLLEAVARLLFQLDGGRSRVEQVILIMQE